MADKEIAASLLTLWCNHPFLCDFKTYPNGVMVGNDDIKLSEVFIKGEIVKYLQANGLQVKLEYIDLIFYDLYYSRPVSYSTLDALERYDVNMDESTKAD